MLLQQLFDGVLDGFPARVAAHFRDIYNTENAFQQIPILDVHNPPGSHQPHTVVRFQAMIQDNSLASEIYLARRANGQCGGWGLNEETDYDSFDNEDLRECTILWAVSIPGITPWLASANGPVPHQSPQSDKYPLPNEPHIGVKVKIYDNVDETNFKATDMRTFVGILTSESLSFDMDSSTLVPTIHVLYSLPLGPTIVDRVYPATFPPPKPKEDIRDELIAWVADEGLAGDRDAAEWVVLCALARVQSHHPPVLPPSLTLSKFPPPPPTLSSIPAISHVLSLIFPLLTTIPLSLDGLNNTSFAPESIDESLRSGRLQLPHGSIAILTEAEVSEGTVNERGIANLRTIQDVMSSQSLDYKFPYSVFPFKTDIAFIVVTEGNKSAFFETNVVVPLRSENDPDEQLKALYKDPSQIQMPAQDTLEQYRQLIGGAKVAPFTGIGVAEKTAEYIQNDFVNERQLASASNSSDRQGSQALTSSDLIHRMIIARLLAASLHEAEISTDIWNRVKAIETTRKGRLG